MFKNVRGFSIMEVVMATALVSLLSLSVTNIISSMQRDKTTMTSTHGLQNLSYRIRNAVIIDQSFSQTIADPANSGTTAAEPGPMGCLRTPQLESCAAYVNNPKEFSVLFEGSAKLIDNTNPSAGFDLYGAPCSTFGVGLCVYRYRLTWQPVSCSGLSAACENPPILVTATLQRYSAPPPSAPASEEEKPTPAYTTQAQVNTANYTVLANRFGSGVSVQTLCMNLGGVWDTPNNRCNLYRTSCPNSGEVLTGFDAATGAMLCQSERCPSGQFASYLPNSNGVLTCVANKSATATSCPSVPTQNIQAVIGIRHDGTAICKDIVKLCPGQTVLGIDQNENPICGSPTVTCGSGQYIRQIASDGTPVCGALPSRACARGEYVKEIRSDGTVVCSQFPQCPKGNFSQGVDAAGNFVCTRLPSCPDGRYFQGLDANNDPICVDLPQKTMKCSTETLTKTYDVCTGNCPDEHTDTISCHSSYTITGGGGECIDYDPLADGLGWPSTNYVLSRSEPVGELDWAVTCRRRDDTSGGAPGVKVRVTARCCKME